RARRNPHPGVQGVRRRIGSAETNRPVTAVSGRPSASSASSPRAAYAPRVWHRNHRVGMAMIIGATFLTVLTGFLGKSAVTLTLGPRKTFLPPWYLPAGIVSPNEWLVTSM